MSQSDEDTGASCFPYGRRGHLHRCYRLSLGRRVVFAKTKTANHSDGLEASAGLVFYTIEEIKRNGSNWTSKVRPLLPWHHQAAPVQWDFRTHPNCLFLFIFPIVPADVALDFFRSVPHHHPPPPLTILKGGWGPPPPPPPLRSNPPPLTS